MPDGRPGQWARVPVYRPLAHVRPESGPAAYRQTFTAGPAGPARSRIHHPPMLGPAHRLRPVFHCEPSHVDPAAVRRSSRPRPGDRCGPDQRKAVSRPPPPRRPPPATAATLVTGVVSRSSGPATRQVQARRVREAVRGNGPVDKAGTAAPDRLHHPPEPHYAAADPGPLVADGIPAPALRARA